VPTAYTSSVYATSYVTPTYYVSPTAYVVPTTYSYSAWTYRPRRRLVERVYYPTSYYMPTSYYVPTRYYSPTTYLSTTAAYYPTVLADSYVPTASTACCETAPTVAMAPARPSAPVVNRPLNNDRPLSSTVESEPVNGNIPPNRTVEKPAAAEPAPMPGAVTPLDSGTPTPPTAPAADKDAATVPAKGAEKEVVPPPAAPAEPEPTLLPDIGALQGDAKHDVKKPVYPQLKPTTRVARNVLQGRVIGRASQAPEEGVQITFSDALQRYSDRVATSDAFGRYAVRLPDGDWAVNVTMPSGRTYTVRQVTIGGGQIIDDQGRDVPSLLITR